METILGITNLFVQPATELIKGSIPLLRRQIDYMVHCKRKFNQLKEKLEELERTRNEVKLKVEAARRNVESIHQVVQAWLAKVASETSRDGDDQTILRLVMNDEAVNMINTKCWCSCASGSRYDLNLFERLKQKNTLLILDDVWKSDLNLFQVGIPCGGNHQRCCKVIVTTRRLEVCTSLGSQKFVNVTVLPEADSWRLFRKNVGDLADSAVLGTTSREIAKECGGLPVALVTLGRGLRSKENHVWETTLRELRNSKTRFIEGMEPNVFSSIKLSFDFLENEIYKKCFLLCCLFPEDYKITISDLMAYVVGDDAMFEDDYMTLRQMTDMIKTVLDKLVDSCLLLKKEHYLDLYVVSMHDVIRDVAINIASHQEEGNWFLVKAGSGLKRWPGNSLLMTSSNGSSKCLRRLSLMKNQISELPTEPPELPHLLSLSLDANKSMKEIPDSFFQRMESLATLDLRQTGISSLPSSISLLTNLKALYLDWCKFNQSTDISVIGKLTKLEILSLVDCGLDGLPEEIRNLTNLRFLDLQFNGVGFDHGFTIPRNVISSLSRLEFLNMFYCEIKWDVQEGLENANINAILAEVTCLPFLSGLSLGIPFMSSLALDVKQFSITFTDAIDIMFSNNENNCVLSVSSPVYDSIKVLIQRVEVLELNHCPGLKSVGLPGDNFNNLEKLDIYECHELVNVMSFPRAISSPEGSLFQKLEEIRIRDCDKLKYLFSSSIAMSNLQNVKKLHIRNCSSMVTLIASEEIMVDYHDDNVDDQLVLLKIFPKLKKLEILECKDLKQLRGIGKNNLKMKEDDHDNQLDMTEGLSILDFPDLEYLKVRKCEKLKRIHLTHQCTQQLKRIEGDNQEWFEEALEWENPTDKLHMRTLFIYGEGSQDGSLVINSAHYLVSVFNLNLVKRVPELWSLNVDSCDGLKDVFNLEEIAGTSTTTLNIEEASSDFTFPKLRHMILENLPALVNIWKGYIPSVGCFENLQDLWVSNCHKLSYLFSHSMARNLQNLERLYINDCSGMEKLIASERKMIYLDGEDAKASCKLFPNLKKLQIWDCENLKHLWDSFGKNLEKKEDDDDADDQFVTRRTIISVVDFPCLEHLEMAECKNLKKMYLTHHCTQGLKRIVGESGEWFEEVLEWENPTDKLHMRTLFCPTIGDHNWIEKGSLEIISAHYMVSVFNLNLVNRVPDMKLLSVVDCGGLKDVFNMEELGTMSTTLNIEEASRDFKFSKLKEMKLSNLPILENIWKGYIPSAGCFENLKKMKVFGCHKLSHLFLLSMARSLRNLQELTICGCSGMVKLIEEEDQLTSSKIFPKLRELTIVSCESLSYLWDTGNNLEKKEKDLVTERISILDCLNLQYLEVHECVNLKRIHLTHQCTQQMKEICGDGEEWFDEVLEWENPTDKLQMRSLFYDKVRSLHIFNAHNSVSVFDLNVTKRVPDMEILKVMDCVGLKNVFNLEETGTSTINTEVDLIDFTFSKLREMRFSYLPILEI